MTHISQRLEDHGDGDWDEYVVEINGTIGYLDISDDGVEEAEGEAGRVTAYLLRIGASMDDGQPADSVFDAHSAEVYEAFETIIDRSTMDIRPPHGTSRAQR